MLIRTVVLLTAMLASGPACSQPTWGLDTRLPTAADWRADIRRMHRMITENHPAPHHSADRAAVRREFDALVSSVRGLSDPEILVGAMRCVAAFRDVHTVLLYSSMSLRGLPIKFESFSDGMIAVFADAGHARALGGTLVEINGVPVDTVVERLAELMPEESPGTARRQIAQFLSTPYILAGIGVVDDLHAGTCDYRIAEGGTTRVVSYPLSEPIRAGLEYQEVSAADGPFEPQTEAPGRNWFAYDPDGGAVYLHYAQCGDTGEDEPHSEFIGRFFALLDRELPRRLIVDIRANGGGLSEFNRPLIDGLRERDIGREFGRLFVLVGPGTGSAAVQLTFALEHCTSAVFVGEATGQGTKFYSDPQTVQLPRTGLRLFIPQTYWQLGDDSDSRRALSPDIQAQRSFAGLVAGHDEAITAALEFRAEENAAIRGRVHERSAGPCNARYAGTVPPDARSTP